MADKRAVGFIRGQVAYDAEAVAPSDANTLPSGPTIGLYIGVAGDVALVMEGGGAVTFKAVPVGVLAVSARQVKVTGTTATNILALY